jgi:predicted porin
MYNFPRISILRVFLSTAALSYLSINSSVHAQSSVTLYGSMDVGLGYNSNVDGAKQWEATSGNSQPDQWGLLGVEDLGGGMKAGFRLENGFLSINGQMTHPGYVFNRHAFLFLGSDEYGTVTFGHTAPLSYWWINPLDTAVQGNIYEGYHPGNVDELTTSTPAMEDNLVRYVSPSYRGLQAAAEISFGNTSNFATSKSTGYGLRYSNGPLRTAITYGVENNRATSIGSAIGFTSFQGVAGTDTYIADKLSNLDVAASYALGRFNLHVLYTNVGLQHAGYSNTFQTFEAGTTFKPNVYNLIDLSGYSSSLAGRRWTQASLIDTYYLSKSTSVYAAAVYQRASGGAVAVIYSNMPSSGPSQVALRVGMHHTF